MNLQPQLGGSKAASDFTDKMKKAGANDLYREVAALFTQYSSGLNEMMKMNDPYRKLTMTWWHEKYLAEATERFQTRIEATGVPFSYVDNLLKYRWRQAWEHGAVIEKLKDRDPDWQSVLTELRKHRQWEDKQDREGV